MVTVSGSGQDKDTPEWHPDFFRAQVPDDPSQLPVRAWSRPPQKHLVLADVNIVEVESSSIIPRQSVELAGGKIVAIRSADELWLSPAKIIPCHGLYLCPGLIDCHAHIFAPPVSRTRFSDLGNEFAAAFHMRCLLVQGFTTVRDMGGATIRHREATDEWLTPGPRLLVCGKVLCQTGGHLDASDFLDDHAVPVAQPFGILVDGVDHIKMATSAGPYQPHIKNKAATFTVQEVKTVVQVAEDMGDKYVACHAISDRGAQIAIEGGAKTIEHGGLLSEATLRMMVQKGIHFVPTYAPFRLARNLPEEAQRKVDEISRAYDANLRMAHDLGVLISYGTDALAQFHLLDLDERARVLPVAEVIKHATCNAAKTVRMEELVGCIKVGAYADLCLLDANPLHDIKALSRPDLHQMAVIKDGRCVRSRIEGLAVEVSLE